MFIKTSIRAMLVVSLLLAAGVVSSYSEEDTLKLKDWVFVNTLKNGIIGLSKAVGAEKIRTGIIKEIEEASDEKFNSEYQKHFFIIESISDEKLKYGFTRETTREQALELVKNLDSKDIAKVIRATDDRVVLDVVKTAMAENNVSSLKEVMQRLHSETRKWLDQDG